MNTKTISKYRDSLSAIVQPCSGVVTKKDQAKIRRWPVASRASFCAVHFPTKEKAATVERLKSLKLSKNYIVTIVTKAQWTHCGNAPETLPGTGVHATKKQICDSFIIG